MPQYCDRALSIILPFVGASECTYHLLVALDEWLERATRQASCDFGFHMSITNWSEKIFNEMS